MNQQEIEEYKSLLLKLPTARIVSGGREVLLRCRYCPDSTKNFSSAHMYISIPSDDSPSYFNCYKCGTGGIVTHKHLLQWGLYDQSEGIINLSKYNNRIMKLPKNRMLKDSHVYKLDNKFITQGKLSEIKLKYINKRLGTNLNYMDLINNKIVLNLGDLLSYNRINKFTRNEFIIKELDERFIGFISQDNAFINMRNLTEGKVSKSIDKRYINYNIFNKKDNTMRFYTLPTQINLMNPNPIRINICEGPFDTLSVRYNVLGQSENCIYSSITGAAYMAIVRHFVVDMKLLNSEFHIYIDNDINRHIIDNIADFLYVYRIPLYVHENIMPGEKDFGVPKERIKESIIRVE